MLEEMGESAAPMPAAAVESERELLRFDSDGSKISPVLDKDGVMKKFQDVTLASKPPLACSAGEHSKIVDLITELSSPNLDSQRSAARELRYLARQSAENLRCIAEAGAIPHLVSLLPTTDPGTQEHAVAALLNLSILTENARIIVESNCVRALAGIQKTASRRIREYVAAMLVFLSVDAEAKVSIGESGAIEALATVLMEGSKRGKKDAAQALFLLCVYKGNRAEAVRAGVVPMLMGLLTDMEESVAILQMLASVPEGRLAIGMKVDAVPALVEMIRSGTASNGENAMGVLYHLFRKGEKMFLHMAAAEECGVMCLLKEIQQSGTVRGKRKATELLELMKKIFRVPEEMSGPGTTVTASNDDRFIG